MKRNWSELTQKNKNIFDNNVFLYFRDAFKILWIIYFYDSLKQIIKYNVYI